MKSLVAIAAFVTLTVQIVSARDPEYDRYVYAKPGCRSCFVKDIRRTFRGESFFNYTLGCTLYQCNCDCNGQYNCKDQQLRNCNQRSAQRAGQIGQRSGCQDCVVLGITFPGGRDFDYRRECREMTGCTCACDGTYTCQVDRNSCGGQSSSFSSSSSSRSSSSYFSSSSSSGQRTASGISQESNGGVLVGGIERADCTPCQVGNRRIPPETTFKHTNGCITYDQCVCKCNGFWSCPAETGRDTCSQGSGRVIVGSERSDCRTCNVYGSVKVGGSTFTYRNNCEEWQGCRCDCSGSWDCSMATYRWVCDNICTTCKINNATEYPGNSDFSYTTNCITYDPCRCHCNGSWNCPPESGRWTCQDRCTECKVDGKTHAGNSKFLLRRDCWEWDNCNCNCNGSWNCPKENAKWVCSQRCQQCNVDGNSFEGNKPFQLQKGCWQLNCDCGCDGSYKCPPERTVDTCRVNPATGCSYCSVHGKKFDGNTRFSHTDGCIEYRECVCNCDGSWECPGSKAVDKCDVNPSTGCNYCNINGERFEGNSKFQLTRDCWRSECSCRCDGSWQCSTRSTYACGRDLQPGGCRDCYALGNRVTSRTSFQIGIGCINYQCQCSCDGSWQCPAGSATSTCELPGNYASLFQRFSIKSISNHAHSWCPPCRISSSLFPGNSQFSYQDGCYTHYLRCYCDGSYRVASTVLDNCAEQLFSGSIISSNTSSIFLSQKSSCNAKCVVNGVTHEPRSSFDIQVGCTVFRCQCACSGLPLCQLGRDQLCNAEASIISSTGRIGQGQVVREGALLADENCNTTDGSGASSSSGTCLYCVVDGRRYDGGTSFDYRRGCIKYRCQCNCRGFAMCRTVSLTDCYPNAACKSCQVEGKTYNPNSRFTFEQSCMRVSCRCGCDGSAVCVRTPIPNCNANQGCRDCVYRGVRRAAYEKFNIENTCERTVCQCQCNGEVRCSAPVRTCVDPRPGNCMGCNLGGKYYEGGTSFDFIHGPWKIPCSCDCKGRHNCDRSRAEYLEDEGDGERCKTCSVDGRSITGDTKFTRQQQCYQYQCQCSCDGSHQCVSTGVYVCGRGTGSQTNRGSTSRQTNTGSGSTSNTRTDTRQTNRQTSSSSSSSSSTSTATGGSSGQSCTSCKVGSETYPPNKPFFVVRSCHQYRCQCYCRGTYGCAKVKKVCDDQGRRIDQQSSSSSQSSRSSSSTSSGSGSSSSSIQTSSTHRTSSSSSSSSSTSQTFSYETRKGRYVSSDPLDSNGCRICRPGNTRARPNSEFQLNEGCKRFVGCRCNCDGSWVCPSQIPLNTCSEGSSATSRSNCSCEVRGKVYNPGQSFVLKYDQCRSYQCSCSDTCTRRYQCERDIINTCDTQSSCRNCEVGGRSYAPNKPFSFEDDRFRFNCQCFCNGSYDCPSERTQRLRGSCQSCIVDQNRYPPNAPFSFERGSFVFNCDCKCDGSYVCPPERTRRLGAGGSQGSAPIAGVTNGQCRSCRRGNNEYPPNTVFEFDENCNRFICDCNCDGSYNCPPSRTKDICGIRQSQCRECEVNQIRYQPNTRFQYEEGCSRFNCICNCDGSYQCPAENTISICDRLQPEKCTYCSAGGSKREPNTRFQYDEGCNRYSCDCHCNGTWACPPERTRDICRREQPDSQQCRTCYVGGANRRPNSRFRYDKGCYRYECDCHCNGSYKCPAERTVNKCHSLRESKTVSSCKQCNVGGHLYKGNAAFNYTEECTEYMCECRCDGRHTCPSWMTRKICDENQQCQMCSVKGERYRPNTGFSYIDGCYQYECECRCNGSWNCSPSKTRNVCQEGKSNCKSCEIRGTDYPGDSVFVLQQECNQLHCSCDCNGQVTCPPENTVNVCKFKDRGDLGK